MSLLKICAAALSILALTLFLGKKNAGIGFAVTLFFGVLLAICSIDRFSELLGVIGKAVDRNSDEYFSPMLKALGVGLVCSFTSGLCRDSGENSIAGGVELFGKIEILAICAPLIVSALNLCFS